MAVTRKQQAGELKLVHESGRYLLVQGESVIDVTRVVGAVNYPLGCVTLRLRVSGGRRFVVRDAGAAAEPEPEPVTA